MRIKFGTDIAYEREVEDNTDDNEHATGEFWDYQHEASEYNMKELVDPRHTVVLSKKVINTANLSRTLKFVQGIQEDDPANHEDIGIHGFDFGKKDKKTGWVSLLKLPISL